MTATVQSIRAAKQPRTPEREALARSIENHRGAEAELNRLEEAQRRAETLVERAWRTHSDAETALNEANQQEAAHTVAVLLQEAEQEQSPVARAMAALEKARTALEAARGARAAVQEPLRAAQSRLQLTGMLLRSAVGAAVRTDAATARLIASYQEALKQAVGLRRALQYLDGRSCLADRSWAAEAAWPELPGAASWQQALASLEADPDAPLPCSRPAGGVVG